ncbi:MAG: TIGR02996 domain-containing protein [Myxococcales bacterium]|nr:TIGR02996 domain-containing protein [Myxococcales bacterium]
MPSMMAIVSRKVFEGAARAAAVGDVLPNDGYRSTHRALEPLTAGGSMYLVTVRPPRDGSGHRLWLVSVLREPRLAADGWHAAANQVPIKDITELRGAMRFASGNGLPEDTSRLGMSLQTPRVLSDADVALLEGVLGADASAGSGAGASSAIDTNDDVAAMLAAVAEHPGPSAAYTQAVCALERLPRDARVAEALLEIVEAPRYTAQSMKPMWRSLFEQLVESQADPRSVARLIAVDLARTFGATNMSRWMAEQIGEAVSALLERYPSAPRVLPPDALAARAAAAVRPEREPQTEDHLLAAVAETLDDDGPRLVYADAAAERGDAARAELIHLQVERARRGEQAPSDAEEKLLRKHAKRWLEPIASVLIKDSWEFERGFVDHVQIYPRKGKVAEVVGHPLWSTVRSVRLSEAGDPGPIITHPVMRNLQVVHMWTYPRGLAALLDSDAPLRELRGLYLPKVARDEALYGAFVGCKRLPQLELLEISGARPEQARELFGGGWARPGLQMVLDPPFYDFKGWWRELAAYARSGARAPQIIFTSRDGSEIELDEQGGALCTVDPEQAGDGIHSIALACGLYEDNPQPPPLDLSPFGRVVLRIPPGVMKDKPPAWVKYKTNGAVVEGLKKHCAAAGAELEVREGSWSLRAGRDEW